MKEGLIDFNFGYGLSTFLAIVFLSLGALGLNGAGIVLQDSSGGFIAQFVDVYVWLLDGWAGPVIAVAALATMFSSTLTVIDGYSRSLTVGMKLAIPAIKASERHYLF